MNGNTPYAGLPGVTQAGKRAQADVPELTVEQRRSLRQAVAGVAARTREYLPDEYVVNANVSQAATGLQATVAVRPPVGQPVSAGFTPDVDAFEDEDQPIDDDDRDEVAQGLAASAALQVKRGLDDDPEPTAR
jgi:hypothetical protein